MIQRAPILPRPNEILLGTDGGNYVIVVRSDDRLFITADLNNGFATRRNGPGTKIFCQTLWPTMRWRGNRARSGDPKHLRALLEAKFAEAGIPHGDDAVIMDRRSA